MTQELWAIIDHLEYYYQNIILPTISKVFEIAVKNRLLNHLQTNKLIHPNQYGFMKNSNTTTAASCLVNDIVNGMNRKKKAACIFLDVKKAFDCLNFDILDRRLMEVGVEDKARAVLKNYMSGRKQVVVVDEKRSFESNVVVGAAQGSILGPLLFLIYINDLLFLKLNSIRRLFADDGAFSYEAENYKALYKKMHEDICVIQSFLASLNLEMSIKKTLFMIFRTTNSSSEGLFNKLYFNDTFIEKVDSFKYLGLHIDSRFDWKEHVNQISSKISPYVGILRRIRHCVDTNTLMQIYYSFIHSRLIYCLPVWSHCSMELKMRLQRLQNKAIKLIHFKPHLTPSTELYDEKFLSFLQLCDYEPIFFIYKVSTGLVKCDVDLLTNEQITGRQTRQSSHLRLPQYLMSKSQDSVFYRGLKLFNNYKSCSKFSHETSLSDIKRSIKRFVCNQL